MDHDEGDRPEQPRPRREAKNPIPHFIGNVPSKEEIDFNRPFFLPSKDRRPLLAFQAHTHRYCSNKNSYGTSINRF